MTASDKVDRIVTNRVLAIPIFVAVMLLVYTISIGTVGDRAVRFMNDTLFGEWIIPFVNNSLTDFGCAPWLVSLVSNGIVSGVGSVLSFVPQMLILFFLLSLLEDCGYMSRVAFIMDRLFRKFGLSGKSFIPLLVASGCGVPGIMASRTIEQERDRRMTVMTTGFIPCSAKMPLVGLIAGALFGGSGWVATAAYFTGIAAVILSGLILKKTKPFAGEPAPFVMELPAYHLPVASNVFRSTWDRGWSFIKRAGTVILLANVVVWVLNNLTLEGGFGFIGDSGRQSVLSAVGGYIAVIFAPLGFGNWQSAVASLLGLLAKEEIVGVFGTLSSDGAEAGFRAVFDGNGAAAFSFMIFNLLCAPCSAAMAAIRREMNSAGWTAFAIGYMCAFAYAVSLIIYQFGSWFVGDGSIIGTAAAAVVLALTLFLLFRRPVRKSGSSNITVIG